jgi:hypothetical protein
VQWGNGLHGLISKKLVPDSEAFDVWSYDVL